MITPIPPIRVGFVLHVMQVAGAEMLVAEIIRRLGPRLEPVVFCLDGIGPLGERLAAEGTPVVALARRPGLDLGVAWRMARELRRRQIDVVHAHQYTPFFYAALAKLILSRRLPLIFTEHGRHYPDLVSKKRRWVNRWLLSREADEITGVCEFSIRSLADRDGFGHRRMVVIPNGIDLERYRPRAADPASRARLGLDPSRRHIIVVARFHPVKDHPMLLRAFATVAGRHPDVDLLLAGDGPQRAALVTMVEDLGIGPRVRFLGVREDVPDLLAVADLFALTSVSEAASITLLEAMATGLPVVVTAVGGNPDIVRDGREGLLVPRGDHEAAARALDRLLTDASLAAALGEAARGRVSERFQIQAAVEAYGRLYVAATRASWRAQAETSA